MAVSVSSPYISMRQADHSAIIRKKPETVTANCIWRTAPPVGEWTNLQQKPKRGSVGGVALGNQRYTQELYGLPRNHTVARATSNTPTSCAAYRVSRIAALCSQDYT
jgi:hypothetical protein